MRQRLRARLARLYAARVCAGPLRVDQPGLRARCEQGSGHPARGPGDGRDGGGGLVRGPVVSGMFTPINDVAHNLWYWPDISALTASAFGGAGAQTMAFTVDADAKPAPPGGLPTGGVTRLDVPNRHLEYALTWYGLGLTLIGVYVAFAMSRLRAPAQD